MGRLLSFDYTSPYFYMVTLKRLPGLAPFSQITDTPEPPRDSRGRARYLIASDLTMAFATAIRSFAANSPGLWPIETFIVMPDHLHVLFHLKDTGGRIALAAHVEALMAELSRIYYRMRPGQDGKVHSDLPNSNQSSANQSIPSIFSPEGFGERWHPPRTKEALCAEGRMLYLSLYAPEAARPDNATLHNRCHEMGDIVVAAITKGRNRR